MRRSLLKVARADAVKACSSKWSERHVVGVWFPALVKQARLEDFRVMCIESRSNLGDLAFLRKMQRRWGRTSFRDRERLEKSPAHSVFAIAANLNDCVYALMREARETVLFE